MPAACCGRCMGQDGLCQIFGGIWAPPLGTPSEARYICSGLIGKPCHFKWCPEPVGLHSGNCGMYHTRRSFHRASLKMYFALVRALKLKTLNAKLVLNIRILHEGFLFGGF